MPVTMTLAIRFIPNPGRKFLYGASGKAYLSTGPTVDIPFPDADTIQSDQATSTPFPNCRIYGSGNGVDLVMPSMDHRIAVEVVDKLDDALLQLVL